VPTPLLLLLTLALPSAEAVPDLRGQAHLERRQFRMAAESFRKASAERPDDPEPRLGLARAWAGLEWCGRAVPLFEELRDSSFYGHRAAMDHGACLAAIGRNAEGIEVLEEAVLLSGNGSGAIVQLAWEALKGADEPLFRAVASQLIEAEPGSAGALLLEGARCWLDGDPDGQEAALQALRSLQGHSPQADLLDAWAALELGEPARAAEILRGEDRLNRMRLPEVAVWLAEANRRDGNTEIAHTILNQQSRGRESSVLRGAILLRVRADREGFAAARPDALRLLDAHPDQPEVVATAWYIAMRGGDDSASGLRQRYERLALPDRAPLDLLLPPPPVTPAPSEAP